MAFLASRSLAAAVSVVAGLGALGCTDVGSTAASDASPADSSPGNDSSGCIAYVDTVCVDNNSVWVDSCGENLEIDEICVPPQGCWDKTGDCCGPAKTGALQASDELEATAHFTFDSPGASRLEIDFDVGEAPAANLDTFTTFIAYVDGYKVVFYLHNQLDAGQPALNRGVSLVLIGTFDVADARTDTGSEILSLEGYNALLLRTSYDWGGGPRRGIIERAEADGAADWYELIIEDSVGQQTNIGGVRIARKNAGTASTFEARLDAEMKIDTNIVDYADAPTWDISFWPLLGGIGPLSASSNYPGDGAAEFANVNVDVVEAPTRVRFLLSPTTRRCDNEGTLF